MERISGNYKAKKLLRLSIAKEKNTIKSIQITGDFFIYPENGIETLEASLIGIRLDREKIKDSLTDFFKIHDVLGFDADSLTDAILLVVSGKSENESGSCFK